MFFSSNIKLICLLDCLVCGPEVVAQAQRVMEAISGQFGLQLEFDSADLGGIAIDRQGDPYPSSTQTLAKSADAILLGAVGGPKWDVLPASARPERGLPPKPQNPMIVNFCLFYFIILVCIRQTPTSYAVIINK